MDWSTFAQLWGPAVPMFGVFVYYLHRLIFRTVPSGFRRLRDAVELAEKHSTDRHKEAMIELRLIKLGLNEVLPIVQKAVKKPPPVKKKKQTGRGAFRGRLA